MGKKKTFHPLRHTFISNAKSQSDEIEVVRLPKSLANAIRSKGGDGESIVDVLKRIVDGVEVHAKVEHTHHDEVDELIAEIRLLGGIRKEERLKPRSD